jgi:type III pantothenate kinase
MQKGCVVVDAGTAITVDCCNDQGDFLGGAIAPGAQLMLDALHEKTAKLPRVDLAVPNAPIGQNTEQAILQGVYHGIRGTVKELVENYATHLGFWPDIIVTGGDAQKLFEGWELIHAVSPDLTFYGIALAYAEHYIKHPR